MQTLDMIDRLPVASLPNRYGKARSVIYERIKALKLQTQQEGNKAFVDREQIELLDRAAEHIDGGGTIASFLELIGQSGGQLERGGQPTGQPDQNGSAIVGQSDGQMINNGATFDFVGFMRAIEPLLRREAPPDPLAPQRRLQELSENGWLCSTSQLEQILGTKPREGNRFGFNIRRAGKIGRQAAWKVSRS